MEELYAMLPAPLPLSQMEELFGCPEHVSDCTVVVELCPVDELDVERWLLAF